MLNTNEAKSLLSKLCIDLGFCLPPDEGDYLIENPPNTIDEFTDAVILAEGLNPQYVERHLYRQVRAKIAEAFEKHYENEEFFENWKK